MKNSLGKILKEFKDIKPDADYSRRSRSLILSYRKELEADKINSFGFFSFVRNFQSMRLTLASEMTGTLILAAIFGIFFINQNNNQNLVVQANEINNSIQIKLNEIQYLMQTQVTSTSQKSDLNISLGKAAEELKQAQTEVKDNNIGNSVEKIKSAEKVLIEAESVLKPQDTANASSTLDNASSTTSNATSTPTSTPENK
ncbi:MAG: hypothetical protein NTW60_00360 [Candidatus Wolfebacteria bacterium]|nr:hypothetical protein [Candidatus Wolfebacteria bacterium]